MKVDSVRRSLRRAKPYRAWLEGFPSKAGHYRVRLQDGSLMLALVTPTKKVLLPGFLEDQSSLITHYSPTQVSFPPPPDPPEPTRVRKKPPTTGWWMVKMNGHSRPIFVDKHRLVRFSPGDTYAQTWDHPDFDWSGSKKIDI